MSKLRYTTQLTLVLLLTLSLKVMANPGAEPRRPEVLLSDLEKMLKRQGFVVAGKVYYERTLRVVALNGECRLSIAESDPWGHNLDSLRILRSTGGSLQFVFDGSVYPDQPVRRTGLAYEWTRMMQRMGLNASWSPTLAVGSTPGCMIGSLPWYQIAEVNGSR